MSPQGWLLQDTQLGMRWETPCESCRRVELTWTAQNPALSSAQPSPVHFSGGSKQPRASAVPARPGMQRVGGTAQTQPCSSLPS